MKFPLAIASKIQRKQIDDSAGAAGAAGQNPLHRLVRQLRTRRKGLGVIALAAGIVAGSLLTVFSMSSLTSSPTSSAALVVTPPRPPRANFGTAPQLHVVGNKLVSADGQQVVLHGVDRSGTEYKCVQDSGIFDGPSNAASVDAMKTVGVNAVRVPLNEACWNGDSYVNPAYSGAKYQAAIKSYVKLLNANGMAVILDLHWTNGVYTGPASACSSAEATCQKPMPDAAEAVPFWTSVASTFKGNDSVIFDLFNEPYPEQADHGNLAEGWQCWLKGGNCAGISYPVAGMQTMVNAVRSTGATNVLMLGGLTWSNDLDGWLSHEPVDPDHNLAASWHSYNFNACSTEACWTSQIAPLIAKVPLIAGEIGENNCADNYISSLTSWLNSKDASYLAWAWNTDFNCYSGPGLINNYDGAPTAYGAGYESDLHSIESDLHSIAHSIAHRIAHRLGHGL